MRVAVVTPWYPQRGAPYSGIFVKKNVDAIESLGASVHVEVPTLYPAPTGPIPPNVVEAMESLAGRNPHDLFEAQDNVIWLPSPVPSRSGPMGRARAFRASIELKRKHLDVKADVTHAHLGMPTGWALMRLGASPLIVTEHQSTLGEILANEEARIAYRETLEASDAFICVSNLLKAQLTEAFGSHATSKIDVIPNIVDLADIKYRPRGQPAFTSWVYVGGLVTSKGIETLMEVFEHYRRHYDDTATLTLVGEGPMRRWIDSFTTSRGLGDAVSLAGAVPHDRVAELLDRCDTLVHMSPFETFGISCLEAIGAGLAVVSLRNGGAESTWGDMEAECGLLIDRGATPAEIARQINVLRENPGRLDPEAGRAMVEARFSPEVVGTSVMETYSRCL